MKNVKKCFFAVLISILSVSVYSQTTKPDALKLYNDGYYKEAILICEEEIALNPNNMDSYSVLCWSLVANKQYNEAETRATEARKINAYDVRLIEVLAEAKYFLGKNNEALNLFQRFISNVSENANRVGRAYYYMGEIYIRQTKYNHADIAFSTAVRYEPQKDYWWARLGYAKENAKDYIGALKVYEKALSLNPSQYDANRGKERCQKSL